MGREQGKYCILHCCSWAESATFGAFRVWRVPLSQNVFCFTTAMFSAYGHRKMFQLFVSAKGCGLWLWHSLYFSLTVLVYMKWHGVHLFLQNCMSPRQHPNQPATRVFVVHLKTCGPWLPTECTAKSEKTVNMHKLIWVFLVRTCNFVRNLVPLFHHKIVPI